MVRFRYRVELPLPFLVVAPSLPPARGACGDGLFGISQNFFPGVGGHPGEKVSSNLTLSRATSHRAILHRMWYQQRPKYLFIPAEEGIPSVARRTTACFDDFV